MTCDFPEITHAVAYSIVISGKAVSTKLHPLPKSRLDVPRRDNLGGMAALGAAGCRRGASTRLIARGGQESAAGVQLVTEFDARGGEPVSELSRGYQRYSKPSVKP